MNTTNRRAQPEASSKQPSRSRHSTALAMALCQSSEQPINSMHALLDGESDRGCSKTLEAQLHRSANTAPSTAPSQPSTATSAASPTYSAPSTTGGLERRSRRRRESEAVSLQSRPRGQNRMTVIMTLFVAVLCGLMQPVTVSATEINTAVSVFGPWDYAMRDDGGSRCAPVLI